MSYEQRRIDVAVFIDFENVYVSVRDKLDANPNFETIMERCNDLGRVVIARAYADWYRYPRVTSALYANAVEPIYVPTYYYDRDMGRTGRAIKNSVDMNLCIDAMKALFIHTNVGKYVLVTGDRDFIPLVNSIRQQGKEVIVIGIGGAASAHLAQSADEFIFYEQLVGKVPLAAAARKVVAPPAPRAAEKEKARPVEVVVAEPQEPDIYDTLVEAIHLVRERGYVSTLGSLKLVMKELMGGDFKESRYKDLNGKPFAKFKDFVVDAEKRGKVQIYTNGTVNEVFLPGEDPKKLSQFEIKEEILEGEPEILALTNGHPEAFVAPSAGPLLAPLPPVSPPKRSRRRKPNKKRLVPPQNVANLKQDELEESAEEFEGAEADQDLAEIEVAYDSAALAADDPFSLPEEAFWGPENDQFSAVAEMAFIADGSLPEYPCKAETALEPEDIFAAALERLEAQDKETLDADAVIASLAQEDERASRKEADFALLADQVGEAIKLSFAQALSFGEIEAPDFEIAPKLAEGLEAQTLEPAWPTLEKEEPAKSFEEPPEAPKLQPTQQLFLVELSLPVQETESVNAGAKEEGPSAANIDFSAEEWQKFRTLLASFSKPLPFGKIWELLRERRNLQEFMRTNEQLRNLIKQAIGNGTLERSGGGKHAYYKLKPLSEPKNP